MELSRYLTVTIRPYFYLTAHSDGLVAGREDNYYNSPSKIYFFFNVFHTARKTSQLTICQDLTFFHSPQHTGARHKAVTACDNIHNPLNLKLRPVTVILVLLSSTRNIQHIL